MKSNTLMLLYSRSGNTRIVGKFISDRLGCTQAEIKPKTPYPAGFKGFIRALRHSMAGNLPELEPIETNLRSYDLVLIGGPIWGGKIASPVRSFLKANRGKFKKVAFFATQGGTSAREVAIRKMAEDAGISAVASLVISARELKSRGVRLEVQDFVNRLKPVLKESLLPPLPLSGGPGRPASTEIRT